MDSVKNLAAELQTLETRRTALAGDVDTAQHALDDARDGLITGKVKAAHVTSTQGTYTALDEACATLDGRITEKRAELAAAQAAEAEAARQQRITALDKELESGVTEHDARLRRFDKLITEEVAVLVADAVRGGQLVKTAPAESV